MNGTSTMLDGQMWLLAILFSITVFGGYLWSFRRRLKRDHERLEEASRLGFTRATGQFPYIDPELCIGCGACVAACPEKDVLGLVGGQAVVINGVRCIGIAACETACPVGAIEVGLGEVKGRADLPVLSDSNETSVPGVFIAGELGGLSLVRNAIAQGAQTVRSIHRLACESQLAARDQDFDHTLLIVGSGPAGLSGALTATELGLDCLVIEQEKDLGGTIFHYPRRKLVHTQPIDVPLGGTLSQGEHEKEELLEMFEGLVTRHRVQIAFGERVTGIEACDEGIRVVSAANGSSGVSERVRRGRYVLLSLGRRGSPRKLGVPGESLPKVMYQVRDAELYQGKRIVCVGGGDSAVEAAMGLGRQPGNEVTLAYRKDRFARIKTKNQEHLERAVERGEVRLALPSEVTRIETSSVTLRLPDRERTIDNDYVFIFAGGEPPFGLLKNAGIRFGDEVPA